MDADAVEKRTAKPGWVSRILGLVTERLQGVEKPKEPMPPPPEIPSPQLTQGVQLEGEGFGKLMGRIYEIRFGSEMTPGQLIRLVEQNMAELGPEEIAAFEKSKGLPWSLRAGDEFDITLLGPWDGRVRVIEVTHDSFAYVTLQGHPEAGRIRFSAHQEDQGTLRFCIMSWARARDALVDLSYDKLKVAKSLQATTWRTFLERVVELAGGKWLEDPTVSECVLED